MGTDMPCHITHKQAHRYSVKKAFCTRVNNVVSSCCGGSTKARQECETFQNLFNIYTNRLTYEMCIEKQGTELKMSNQYKRQWFSSRLFFADIVPLVIELVEKFEISVRELGWQCSRQNLQLVVILIKVMMMGRKMQNL